MSALFELPLTSEILDQDEITHLTGCHRKADQVEWLTVKGWIFHKNRAGEPIVGRLYARLKLAGINPGSMIAAGGWEPDFSKVS